MGYWTLLVHWSSWTLQAQLKNKWWECWEHIIRSMWMCLFVFAVCEKLAATTTDGSVRVYAVPVFVLISALLSVLF